MDSRQEKMRYKRLLLPTIAPAMARGGRGKVGVFVAAHLFQGNSILACGCRGPTAVERAIQKDNNSESKGKYQTQIKSEGEQWWHSGEAAVCISGSRLWYRNDLVGKVSKMSCTPPKMGPLYEWRVWRSMLHMWTLQLQQNDNRTDMKQFQAKCQLIRRDRFQMLAVG